MDVGVHRGEHFRELQALGGVIVGFEPCPDFAMDIPNVHRYALSSQIASDRAFYQNLQYAGASGLLPTLGVEHVTLYGVPVTTLDLALGVIHPRLVYLKIDVEGHEMDVLQGGIKTIRQDEPIISVEFSMATAGMHGREAGDLWKWCEWNGYTIHDLWGNPCGSYSEWMSVVDQSYWDYLLVPNSRWLYDGDLTG